MCLRRKKKGKSKVLSGGFCIRDSEADQRVLQLLHIYCSVANRLRTLQLLNQNKQNPRDRTLDLPFFFCYKHLTSL